MLVLKPEAARRSDVGTILLLGEQGFF